MEKYNIVKNKIREALEEAGLHTEEQGKGLTFTLTKIGLSGIYADITEEEILLAVDNFE